MTALYRPNMAFVSKIASILGKTDAYLAQALGMSIREYRYLTETDAATIHRLCELLDDVPVKAVCLTLAADEYVEPTQAHYVYRCFGSDGEPLYVGCTRNLRRRLSDHRRSSGWASEVAKVRATVHQFRSEALDVERREIRRLDPAYNVAHKIRQRAADLASAS